MGAYIHLGMFTEKLTQNEIIASKTELPVKKLKFRVLM